MDKYFKLIRKFFDTSCFEIKRTETTLMNLFTELPGNEIALSLNGGKDSTVVLFLALYFMQINQCDSKSKQKLKCVYMKEKNPFKEILTYLNDLKSTCDIEVYEYDNDNVVTQDFMKHALAEFVSVHNIKAIISGTRSTDPYCQNLDLIVKTDVEKGWPDILRVMPIYVWRYDQVWSFILKNELPYCSLYKEGYTYVGDKVNSISNPFLKCQPAWYANDNIELFSRTSLFNKLTRKDNKLYFNQDNTLLIILTHDVPLKTIAPDDYVIINKTIKLFGEREGYNIEYDIYNPYFIKAEFSSIDIKNNKVVEIKRITGNYDKLYLTIVYDPNDKKVQYIGF